jgi:carboxypeptidase C (cathepsin A)
MTDRRTVLAMGAGAILMPRAVFAAPAEEPVISSRQRITVKGGQFDYEAQIGRLVVGDAGGLPRGRMFFTAYRGTRAVGRRPVLFFWNGGPGAPASLLHLQSFGPKRLVEGALIDNDDTLLTHADLVFVDPISTGFSRADSDTGADAANGTLADIALAASFVRAWRARFNTSNAPLFAFGESFGGPRVSGLAEALAATPDRLSGAILLSGGRICIDARLAATSRPALALPVKSMAAFHHGKLGIAAGRDLETVHARSLHWATTVYAPALARRDDLSDAERDQLAMELADWLGLDQAVVDRRTLVVEQREFRTRLIPGHTLYQYDLRQIGPPAPDRGAAATLRRYFADTLGYRTDLAYWGEEPGQPPVNARWKYTGDKDAFAEAAAGGGPPENQGWLSRAIGKDADLRIVAASGIWDSQNSVDADRAVITLGSQAERRAIAARSYGGGHMAYADAPARRLMKRDLTAFMHG